MLTQVVYVCWLTGRKQQQSAAVQVAGTAGYRAVGSAHVHPTAATRVRVSAMSSSEIQLQTGLLLFWRNVVSYKAKHSKKVRFIH